MAKGHIVIDSNIEHDTVSNLLHVLFEGPGMIINIRNIVLKRQTIFWTIDRL